ncbi:MULTISPECIES: hypothetical protein [unclassified Microbacterium]|uniref:hypothetical protein n=1 Tax=unclassified Microbacterium TaxID=2609290 RepID=UPI0012FC900C|nr:hypothetical protein [Microbacterium sp. MAH-37]MVQ41685.1 hypothetical protein [Microbacterium sp. MAH-37]
MSDSSTLLKRLVENGADMEGQAVDKLAEIAGEMHAELGRAADLYDVVAPHIVQYASDLETSKAAIDPILQDLDSLWITYQQKKEEAASAASQMPNYPTGADADDEQARQDAIDARDEAAQDAAGAATGARGDWDARAADYDREWNTWHTAFTNAASNIREDMSDKIEDGFWDNVDGFLQFMSDFLAVAGIVLAVLAIIIGGPIIAALAAIVAVATLIVAVARLARGNGSVLDVVFGVIGVIPLIGPAIKFARGPMAMIRGAEFGADGARYLNVFAGRAPLSSLSQIRGGFTTGFAEFSARLFTGDGVSRFAVEMSGVETLDMVGNIFASHFAIAGGIKDSAGGAWAGTFDPDQNPFS